VIGGIIYPIAAGILNWTFFVGRVIYTAGYFRSGSRGRVLGAIIADIALIDWFIYSIVACYKIISEN